jgi:hypothetical protein
METTQRTRTMVVVSPLATTTVAAVTSTTTITNSLRGSSSHSPLLLGDDDDEWTTTAEDDDDDRTRERMKMIGNGGSVPYSTKTKCCMIQEKEVEKKATRHLDTKPHHNDVRLLCKTKKNHDAKKKKKDDGNNNNNKEVVKKKQQPVPETARTELLQLLIHECSMIDDPTTANDDDSVDVDFLVTPPPSPLAESDHDHQHQLSPPPPLRPQGLHGTFSTASTTILKVKEEEGEAKVIRMDDEEQDDIDDDDNDKWLDTSSSSSSSSDHIWEDSYSSSSSSSLSSSSTYFAPNVQKSSETDNSINNWKNSDKGKVVPTVAATTTQYNNNKTHPAPILLDLPVAQPSSSSSVPRPTLPPSATSLSSMESLLSLVMDNDDEYTIFDDNDEDSVEDDDIDDDDKEADDYRSFRDQYSTPPRPGPGPPPLRFTPTSTITTPTTALTPSSSSSIMILDLGDVGSGGGTSVSTFILASTNDTSNNTKADANTTATTLDISLIMEDDSDEEDNEDHTNNDPPADADAPLLAVDDTTTTLGTMSTSTQGHVLADNPDDEDNDDVKVVEGPGSLMPVHPTENAPLASSPSVDPKTGMTLFCPNAERPETQVPFAGASTIETASTCSASKQDDDGRGQEENGNSTDSTINTVREDEQQQLQPLDTPLRDCKDLPIWITMYSRLVFWVNLISISLCTLAGVARFAGGAENYTHATLFLQGWLFVSDGEVAADVIAYLTIGTIFYTCGILGSLYKSPLLVDAALLWYACSWLLNVVVWNPPGAVLNCAFAYPHWILAHLLDQQEDLDFERERQETRQRQQEEGTWDGGVADAEDYRPLTVDDLRAILANKARREARLARPLSHHLPDAAAAPPPPSGSSGHAGESNVPPVPPSPSSSSSKVVVQGQEEEEKEEEQVKVSEQQPHEMASDDSCDTLCHAV